jgi:phage-related holin
MEFLNKLIYLLKKPFIYFISLMATLFDIAIGDGSINKLAVMFLLLSIMPFIDFFFAIIGRAIKGYAIRSHKISKTFYKLLVAYGVFFSLSFVFVLINGIDNLVSIAIYYATWTFVVVFTLREILSIFETAEILGMPVPKSVRRIIDGIPEKMEQEYELKTDKTLENTKIKEDYIEEPIEVEEEPVEEEKPKYKYRYKKDEEDVDEIDLLYGKGGDMNG